MERLAARVAGEGSSDSKHVDHDALHALCCDPYPCWTTCQFPNSSEQVGAEVPLNDRLLTHLAKSVKRISRPNPDGATALAGEVSQSSHDQTNDL
jgi:hypothetical protein